MTYAATDFQTAFLGLLPPGAVWPRDPNSVEAQGVLALMAAWERLAARDLNLLTDAFPTTTVELLPEWQASLGLPDPCAGAGASVAQQRDQVVARFTEPGGQSIAYYEAFAASLGYTLAITEYWPASFEMGFGQPQGFAGPDWAFAWRVEIVATAAVTVSPAALACELRARAPAHAILIIGDTFGSPLGGFTLGVSLLADGNAAL